MDIYSQRVMMRCHLCPKLNLCDDRYFKALVARQYLNVSVGRRTIRDLLESLVEGTLY